MPVNDRLRAAMNHARLDIERVASELGVDAKTVQRWLAGRTPRPRHRWALAELLGADDEGLWPGASASLDGRRLAGEARVVGPVDLRPHVEHALTRPDVTIDFAGFSGETLAGVIQEPLDKVRIGLLHPERIVLRLLLPDTRQPMGLPCRAGSLEDDPDFRARAVGIMCRQTDGIVASLRELEDLGAVRHASASIRVYRCTPLFKLYLIGEDEAFFGFYPVREHTLLLGGEERSIYDLMGKGDPVPLHAHPR